MQRLSEWITIISGLLSGLFLTLNSLNNWDLPLLETVCWVVLILDVFMVLIRPQILNEMTTTRNEMLAMLRLAIPSTISEPIVRKYSQKALSAISLSMDEFAQKNCYIIENPYSARDISFEIIQSIEPGDHLWATMNLVDRPFLLEEAYTSYFLSIHEDAMKGKRTHVDFIRIFIIDNSVSEGVLGGPYRELRDSLERLGVKTYEASPTVFQSHSFRGDLLLRTRGQSRTDRLCLLGDKDPTTPLDPYNAKLLTGDCPEIDHWRNKLKAICRQITGGLK